jgi:hypothetical protein
MAKSNKNSKLDFLTKRRQTIAEMANKRRQQQLLRGPGISVGDSRHKMTTSVSLSGTPPRVTPS